MKDIKISLIISYFYQFTKILSLASTLMYIVHQC